MTNAELIKALRYCKADSRCGMCEWYKYCESRKRNNESCLEQLHDDAADALEAAYKLIADLRPKEGKWIRIDEYIYDEPWECSNCETTNSCRSRYCPNCGAKMDGERKDGEHEL